VIQSLENLIWDIKSGAGAGLSNMGNTCFLNAGLQCLTYTPALANLFLKKKHSSQCYERGFCPYCCLEKHVNMALNNPNKVVSPRELVSNIKSISKLFRNGAQEDSHEFLRCLIDGVQQISMKVNNLSKDEQYKTEIFSIFGGYLRSKVTCFLCKYESDTYDPFMDLCIDIGQYNNLIECLKKICIRRKAYYTKSIPVR